MRLFFAVLFVYLGIRNSHQSSNCIELSPEAHDRWKRISVALFCGILFMLSVIVFLLWKLFKLTKQLESLIGTQSNVFIEMGNNDNTDTSLFPEDPTKPNNEIIADSEKPLLVNDHFDLNLDRNFEVDKKNLEILEVIEKGLFNITHKGKLKMANPKQQWDRAKRRDVIVKDARNQQDSIQQRMILDELKAMCEIGKHSNVLALVGFVVNPSQMLIVTEYTEGGSLLLLLKNCTFENNLYCSEGKTYSNPRSVANDNLDSLCTFDLLSFAYQIANGMKYLASLSYVHRQLALRSVYITRDKTIRIGNFGLARRHGNNEYYRIIHKDLPLSFHWMAPETFSDHKFTEKSDVWCFAVCLWELFTLGGMPYKDVSDVLTFLKKGRRLPEPQYCHREIYDLMLSCWDMDPDSRPAFPKCVEYLEDHLVTFAPQVRIDINEKLRLASKYQNELENWTHKDDDEEYL